MLQAYPYCDSWSLSWPYRRAIILQELQQTSGDVICLQEVQADYYEAHILSFMSDLGYDGLFLQKTRDFTGSYVKVHSVLCFFCAQLNDCTEISVVSNACVQFASLIPPSILIIWLDVRFT